MTAPAEGTPAGDAPAGKPQAAAVTTAPAPVSDSMAVAFQAVLDKNKELERDNAKYRARFRSIKAGDGAILTKDEAEEFEAYKALGKIDEIKVTLSRSAELQGQLEQRDKESTYRDAATALGWSAEALAEVAQAKSLTIEIHEVEKDGTTSGVPFAVTGEGEAATKTELGEYVESNLAVFLPALQVKPADTDQPKPQPKPWVEQKPGGKAPETAVTPEQIAARKRRSNTYSI
jgi:hypothetical protein